MAAASGDQLSESESEDEDEYVPPPTAAEAWAVFDRVSGASMHREKRVENLLGSEEGKDLRSRGDAGMGLSRWDDESRRTKFQRDDAITRVEVERRRRKEKDAELLMDRMGSIALEVGDTSVWDRVSRTRDTWLAGVAGVPGDGSNEQNATEMPPSYCNATVSIDEWRVHTVVARLNPVALPPHSRGPWLGIIL